jgi:hypothetical protein
MGARKSRTAQALDRVFGTLLSVDRTGTFSLTKSQLPSESDRRFERGARLLSHAVGCRQSEDAAGRVAKLTVYHGALGFRFWRAERGRGAQAQFNFLIASARRQKQIPYIRQQRERAARGMSTGVDLSARGEHKARTSAELRVCAHRK